MQKKRLIPAAPLLLAIMVAAYGKDAQGVHESTPTIDVSVRAQQHAKMPLLIGLINEGNHVYADIAHALKKDLEFSEQFAVTVRPFDQVPTRVGMQELAAQGYPLAIFLEYDDHDNAVGWRLYDTQQVKMEKGKRTHTHDSASVGLAHAIADQLWPALTGHDGFFSTKIAYAKEVRKGKKRYKYIYVADFDGSNAHVLGTPPPTMSIAPRWNRASDKPRLFYSESTNTNVRLIGVSMDGKRKVVSGFDGINMVPTFSAKGDKVVYCASRGKGNCQLYAYTNNVLTPVTNNKGNNVSPSLSSDGTKLFFCSDFQTGYPHIYKYDFNTKQQVRVTTDSALSFCPAYWDKEGKEGKLAYTKIVHGVTQLFVYDEKTAEHKQVTFDAHNKDECSWSPCGNYILYSAMHNGKNRLAVHSVLTNNNRFITAAGDDCSYPAWSPRYDVFPIVA